MTNSFSFSRLWLLIKKQWFDNTRYYLLSVLALFGLMVLVFIFYFVASQPVFSEENTMIMFFVGLYITGFVFASVTFSALGDRPKGIYWMTVPATHLEKLVCGILYSNVVFTIVYVLCFAVVQQLTFSIIRLRPDFRIIPMGHWDEPMKFAAYFFFPLQALYLLGSVYFERYNFVKTTLLGLTTILLFLAYLYFNYKIFLPENASIFSPTSFILNNAATGDNTTRIYELSQWIEDTVTFLMKYMWIPVFWVVTYFRLKEKEI
jgi:hypothetical protein